MGEERGDYHAAATRVLDDRNHHSRSMGPETTTPARRSPQHFQMPPKCELPERAKQTNYQSSDQVSTSFIRLNTARETGTRETALFLPSHTRAPLWASALMPSSSWRARFIISIKLKSIP